MTPRIAKGDSRQMSTRKEDISENLEKLERIEKALEELRQHNEETIQALAWQDRRITGSIRDIRFARYVYGTFTESELQGMPEATFAIFVSPLNRIVSAGSIYIEPNDKPMWIREKTDELTSSVSSMSGLTSIATGDTAANIMNLAPVVGIDPTRFSSAIERYLSETKVDEDLGYIKSELSKLDTAAADDFQHFLDNYFSSQPNDSKYQELIGSRSLFFQKTIFGFADKRGISAPSRSRRDQIEAFVYGNNPARDPSADATVDTARDLWTELSSQDSSGLSVKMGKVTSEYVQLTFNKMIIVISTLLKQRELHFRA